jgi:glycosyltransferase involved in cell wall biosynthesis
MKLSILIATIEERREQFNALRGHIKKQIAGLESDVEIISACDNKEMSIGAKRDVLYKMAHGKYSVMVDDDDSLSDDYIKLVLPALKTEPDCVGYKEYVNFNGEARASIFSLRFKEWENCRPVRHGIWYHRTPFCKTPIKTEICRKVGVKDMRFAEDHDFAKRVYPFLKTEVFIDEFLYYYNTKPMSAIELKNRYGI